jgi:LysM repeat protein
MFMAEVNRELAQGRLAIALQKLSSRYDDLNLSEDEREQILDLLDQIAYAVIYSPESLLEPPYVVQPGDTLQRIAQSYGVPWQLLARINGIADPNSLTPGQKIKVLRGPFDAEIDLPRRELTLKLHGLYAGRFALPLTPDPATLQSVYFVEDKSAVPGQWWIRLSGGTEIRGAHEVSAGSSPASTNLIAVEPDQIENLHTILSVGSRVRILR